MALTVSHVLRPTTNFLRNLGMRTWQYVCHVISVVKLDQLCVHVAKSYAVSKEEVIWRTTHDRRTLVQLSTRGLLGSGLDSHSRS